MDILNKSLKIIKFKIIKKKIMKINNNIYLSAIIIYQKLKMKL